MELSHIRSGVAAYTSNVKGDSGEVAARKPLERPAGPRQEGNTQVQLSAQGRAKSAAAQAEGVAARPAAGKDAKRAVEHAKTENQAQAEQSRKASQTEERRADQAQQAARHQKGFSFNGVAAYSRVSSS